MTPVRIANVAVAHPPLRVSQADAARDIARESGEPRRVAALARHSGIEQRAVVLPPRELLALKGSGARNDVYRRFVPELALAAAQAALGEMPRSGIAALVTSSCTGYTVPSWGVGLAARCGLSEHTMRLPITEAGCAGGVLALARATEHLRASREAAALVVAAELCSLAFHRGGDEGNLTSKLIFGDGAGAALLLGAPGPGLEVLDSLSALVPGTEHLLGFDLTDEGFYPVLDRELVNRLPTPTGAAVDTLLRRNGLAAPDIDAWLLHPGGPRILDVLERELGLRPEQTRWSWESLREFGNTSSAAIFDVIRRYLEEPAVEAGRATGHAIVAGFGPGVSIELLLVRRC
jgi:alkylresorcinol/alkylpyrone synthase